MHLVEEHYYTINKIVLKSLGIWPHNTSRLVRLQRVVVITLVITYIILQFSVFITMKYNMDLFIKTMSIAFLIIIIAMKYCTVIFKLKTIRMLHHYIQEDWKIMQNKLENDIMKKFAHECRNYIIFLFLFGSFLGFILFICQFFPVILDVILPLEKPRLLQSFIRLEYFISQDNYVYTVILHELIVVLLCALMFLGTVTQLLLLAHHSFGMFTIASNRIEHIIDDRILYMPNCERVICEKIMHFVIVHRRAIEYCNILTSSFNLPFCIFAIIGVLSLSLNLFRFIQATTVSKNMEDIVISFFITMGHLIYMFLANYIGQKVTDYNHEIFKLVYDVPWYLMPVTSQKLILFLLQRTGKDVCYIIGFIFVAKIENFAMLVNTALSYVAVMYSVQ